jgi:hypothetical protein
VTDADCELDAYEDPAERRVQTAVERAEPYIDHHRDEFAGNWVEYGDGGRYHVAFVGDLDAHRRHLAALLPDPDALCLHRARYAEHELQTLVDRLMQDSEELENLGIHVFVAGVDPKRNLAAIELVAPDGDVATATLRERYGEPLVVEYMGSELTVVEPVAWDSFSIDAGGCILIVHYLTHPSYDVDRVEHSEDDQTIRVTVFERMSVGPVSAVAVTRTTSVHLQRPVGARRVIDGATGEERGQGDPRERWMDSSASQATGGRRDDERDAGPGRLSP